MPFTVVNAGLTTSHFAYGTIASATGAAITAELGFRPRYVKVMNVTGNCFMEWIQGMGDGYGQKTVDSGSGTTDVSTVTSGGITPAANGFSLGTDADINPNAAEALFFIAFG